MASVIEIVRSIRNVRAQFRVEPARWLEAHVLASGLKDALQRHTATIEILARARPVIIKDTDQPRPAPEEAVLLVLNEVELALPLAGMVDMEAERRRLSKELAENEAEIGQLEKSLADVVFLAKAPARIVEQVRGKLATQRDKLERLREQIARLG
jgi:valyl-tRNA synthetase